MSLPVANIIQGPAIVVAGGYTYYTKGDITRKTTRDTFKVETSMHGQVDERMKSVKTEISFQPCGMIEGFATHFPYDLADIGASMMTGTVVIKTLAGKVHTWARGGITKSPPLRLKATDTVFGDMTITCLGSATLEENNAAAQVAVTSVAFADISFDETKIKTAHYTAAWGATPYDVMEALDGFEIDVAYQTSEISVDAYGLKDIVLKSIAATAKFTPIGLTEEQMDTLFALQNSGVVLPGESLTKSDTNLVITSTPLVCTLYKAGPKDYASAYGVAKPRLGEIMFVNRATWTTGVANPLWAFTPA